MLSTKLNLTKLKNNLSKITKTVQERQKLHKILIGPGAARDAEVKRLAAIQNAEIKKLLASKKAGFVIDPADKTHHVVQADTGVRIISMDGTAIKNWGAEGLNSVAFPLDAMVAMLARPDFENLRKHMYLDSKGFVTAAIGHKIGDENEAVAVHATLNFTVKSTGQGATATEVKAEFKFLNNNKAQYVNWKAGAFEPIVSLEFLPGNAETLAKEDVKEKLEQLKNGTPFPSDVFNTWPEGVQRALVDIVFTMGKQGFLNHFKILPIACLHRDWKTAKAQSSRKSVSPARNTEVANLFDPAIQAEKFYISVDPQIAKQRRIFTTDGSLKLITLAQTP